MKKILSLLFLFLCSMISICGIQADDARKSKVVWLTNYEDAVNQSRTASKPIILFFTGSDWCGWCNRLEEEVLDTDDFAEASADKFIFVKLDFPLYSNQDSRLSAQNKSLQKKYDIRSFPTIVILDSDQQKQIGVTGYRPGGGKQYAAHLFKMVSDYSGYKQKAMSLDKQKLSGMELKKLYEKSKELNLDNDTAQIMRLGLKSDQESYFLIERYRFLAEEGQIHSKEASSIKRRIHELDPKNENQTQYQVAVIEFESNCEEMEKDHYACEKAVLPLLDYIERFGADDKDNMWRLHMIISQVFLDKNKLGEALKHAKASYETAPSTVQPEIATAIKNIQSQISRTPH